MAQVQAAAGFPCKADVAECGGVFRQLQQCVCFAQERRRLFFLCSRRFSLVCSKQFQRFFAQRACGGGKEGVFAVTGNNQLFPCSLLHGPEHDAAVFNFVSGFRNQRNELCVYVRKV